MEGQDIRGLMEAYSQVYETPEVLNEEVEQLDEMGQPGARPTGQNSSVIRTTPGAGSAGGSGSGGRRGSGVRYSTSVITANPPAKPKPTFQNSGGFGRYGAPSTQVKTPTEKPASAKPGSNAPAPARPSATPAKPTSTQKPTAPAAPAKPAPGTKAAGPESIKPKTPNPLLADKSIERMQQASQMRQKGANVTSDMISDKSVKVPTPVPQMSARAQALKAGGPAGSARERMLNQDVDIFDLVKGHLLDEGYAETEENALVIMANMSEEWRQSILDEASYSAKAARAGKDIGKPGKMFGKIAKEAGERYGSEERGKKVAGAVLAKLRKEEVEEIDEAQRARENPEDHDKEEKRKYEPVRGEKTPMPPRGDKRREDFEKWYAKHVR